MAIKINKENEEFFLKLVADGLLSIAREGVAINTKTGNRIGKKPNSSGYCAIGWRTPGTRKIRHGLIHRLVFWLYGTGFTEERPYVNHKDGNKTNNHIDNLESASNGENVLHALETGLKPYTTPACQEAYKQQRGYQHSTSTLSREQAIEIIALHRSGGFSHYKLADMFGVNRSTITYLLNKKTYKNVWEEIN